MFLLYCPYSQSIYLHIILYKHTYTTKYTCTSTQKCMCVHTHAHIPITIQPLYTAYCSITILHTYHNKRHLNAFQNYRCSQIKPDNDKVKTQKKYFTECKNYLITQAGLQNRSDMIQWLEQKRSKNNNNKLPRPKKEMVRATIG